MSEATVEPPLTPSEDSGSSETATIDTGVAETTSAPEPETAPEPKPHGDVYPCNIQGIGTFDKGVADLKLSESSDIDLDRTQLLILVKDGIRYTFNRTKIEPLK